MIRENLLDEADIEGKAPSLSLSTSWKSFTKPIFSMDDGVGVL